MNKELVSIIIRTKNEEKWISSCLKSVFKQNYKNFEVIIVDNESSDNTVKRAKEFNVKVISIRDFYPGRAINEGIRNSNGEIIVCLSGHCIPTNNDWLKNLISNLDKDIAGVYGRQEPLSFTSDLDKRDLLTVFGRDKKIQIKDSFFHNANSALTRKIWKQYPFSETLTNIEDRVWGQEVINAKFKIIYEPEASVYHWHGIHQDLNPDRASNIVKILENIKGFAPKKATIEEQRILAVIPVKGPSLLINNTNLLDKTISEIRKSNLITDIAVATDDIGNVKIADLQKVISVTRPDYLSEDYIDIFEIVEFALDKLEETKKLYDIVVLIEEIFPFRKYQTIDEMIIKLVNNGYDTIFAGKSIPHNVWKFENGTYIDSSHSDHMSTPTKFRKNRDISGLPGLCTVTHSATLRNKIIFSGKLGIHEIESSKESIEIRNDDDLSLAEIVIRDEITNEEIT